jgi:conjugative relaxase-like TrwC/TraI family protein
MLSIGKLVDVDYYLDRAAADGIEAYYSLGKEAPGRWLGHAASTLGLSGRVDGAALKAVLEGVTPGSGLSLGLAANRRVKGFDLCFRAPKSVSVLAGLGDPDIERLVHACHDRAVTAALGYPERHATWTRRGRNGVDVIAGSGLVGAGFRHRSSRAGDPHLHTHVLVANMTMGADGRWSTLDGRFLYEHAKTAGYLYEAQLRDELTRELGVAWGPVRNGIADIAGVAPTVLSVFSKRRAEIEARLAERGLHSARAGQIATLDTRRPKPHDAEVGDLRARWRAEAEAHGLDAAAYRAVFGRASPAAVTAEHEEHLAVGLSAPMGLTQRKSTFDRRAVLQALCEQLPAGAAVILVEDLAERYLARPEVVRLGGRSRGSLRRTDGRLIPAGPSPVIYSTTEMLAIETALIAAAAERRRAGCAVAHVFGINEALAARPTLAPEQVRLVTALTTSGNGVDVVAAAAGTGKTFSLDAARDVWQRCGYKVVGAALAARAAAELESGSGIRSTTVARLLADLDRPESAGLTQSTVLVVDEAAMVGTRTLNRVLAHAAASEAKVVLVGDARQLPEVDAGGAFAGLARRLGSLTLRANRRQAEAWERAALASLRAGQVTDALDAYLAHDRVVSAPTADQARETLVADWWAAGIAGETTLMMAVRHADVDDLNGRARARMLLAARLSGPTLEVAGRMFQAGDRVMCLRNNIRLKVRNGTVGTVTDVDPTTREISLRDDRGRCVTLPTAYLDAGQLTHAYATTVHKAQGTTVDRALLLGNDDLYLELGYVALSRGRGANHLYIVGAEPDDHDECGSRPTSDRNPVDEVLGALGRSNAKSLALDVYVPSPATLGELIAERNVLRRLLTRAGPDPSADLKALTDRRAEAAAHLRRKRDELDELRSTSRHRLRRLKPNLMFAESAFSYATGVVERIDAECRRVQERVAARIRFLDSHIDDIQQLDRIERAIDTALDGRLADIGRRPPRYLTDTLGPIPEETPKRNIWWSTARAVELYRAAAGVTDLTPLGSGPTDPNTLNEWLAADDRLRRAGRVFHANRRLVAEAAPVSVDLGL